MNLDKIIKKAWEKFEIDKAWNDWYKWPQTYFEMLKEETLEVTEELRKNNTIYLEDELWDILWSYINFLNWLENEWYIDSIENVIKRCEKKYFQRVDAITEKNIDKVEAWKKIKNIQKEELKKEHNLKYN